MKRKTDVKKHIRKTKKKVIPVKKHKRRVNKKKSDKRHYGGYWDKYWEEAEKKGKCKRCGFPTGDSDIEYCSACYPTDDKFSSIPYNFAANKDDFL